MRSLLRARTWLKSKSLDVRMGQCSGFPLCCITWYLTGWRLLLGDVINESVYDKPAWRANLILGYHRLAGDSGYVPCPLCLISGARVRVRRCTDECGHLEECRELGSLRRQIRDL